MGESSFLPDVFRDDALETSDLVDQDQDERFLIQQRQEELLRQQAVLVEPPREVGAQPTRPVDRAVDQPAEEGPGFATEALRATIGGVLGEIRDIVVNVDRLTDAGLTALGILEEDEKEGILGLQELLPDIAEPETAAGKLVRGIVEFATGFILFGAAGRGIGMTNRFLVNTVAGAAEAGFGKGEDEGRLTDFVTQLAPSLEDDRIIGGLVQFLQSDDQETALEAFGKDVLEDVLVGFGVDGALFAARRVIEAMRGSTIKDILLDQTGGVRFGPEEPPIQGPTRAPIQGPEPFPGARTPEELFGDLPEPVLRPEADPISQTIAAVENAAPVVTNRVAKRVRDIFAGKGKPLIDPPLLARPEEGNYSKEAIAKIAGTNDIHDPLFRVVANFTVERGREISEAAQDALDNGFNTQNRQAAYTGLQEMMEGYNQLGRVIREGRDVVTAQTAANTGKSSRWTRQVIQRLQDGSAGIDEATFFRELAENPARIAQSLASGQRNFFQMTGDVLTELFYSGALSAPSTLVRAALGAPILFGYEVTSKVIGGVITGNQTNLLGEAAAEVTGAFGGLWDGIRVFGKSLGEENVSRSAMIVRGMPEPQVSISGEAFGFTGRMGTALDAIGKAIRMPTRILGSIDKGTEVVLTRMVLHREAHRAGTMSALTQGIGGSAVKVAHRDTYTQVLDTELGEQILKLGKQETRRLTLSGELQPGLIQDFNNLINSNVFLRMLVPFVRVSSNAIIQSVEKAPVLSFIQKRQRDILLSGSANDKAILAGQQALGSMVMAGAALMTINGFMTGAAPQNPSVREAWRVSGRKEYSLNIPTPDGQVVAFQYAKFGEPIGFLLGAVADLTHGLAHIQDNLNEEDNPPDKTPFTEAAEVLGLAFAQNISKRTFMQSVVDLSQAMTDPIRFASKFTATTATTLIPLGGLIRSVDREANPELPEVATFMDRVYSRVPWFNQSLPPKRNLFGEPIEYQPGFGAAFINPELIFGIPAGAADMFSPVVIGSVEADDPAVVIGNVIRENRLVPEGVRAPSTFRGIKFTAEEKDFAARRRGEIVINGKDMKQALFDLVQSEHFDAANPGKDGVQEAMMSRMINLYNRAAVIETIEEFGDIFNRVEARLDRIRPQ